MGRKGGVGAAMVALGGAGRKGTHGWVPRHLPAMAEPQSTFCSRALQGWQELPVNPRGDLGDGDSAGRRGQSENATEMIQLVTKWAFLLP